MLRTLARHTNLKMANKKNQLQRERKGTNQHFSTAHYFFDADFLAADSSGRLSDEDCMLSFNLAGSELYFLS